MTNVISFEAFRSHRARQPSAVPAEPERQWREPTKLNETPIVDPTGEFELQVLTLSYCGQWVNIKVKHLRPSNRGQRVWGQIGWSIPGQRLSFSNSRRDLEGHFPQAIDWLHETMAQAWPAAASQAR